MRIGKCVERSDLKPNDVGDAAMGLVSEADALIEGNRPGDFAHEPVGTAEYVSMLAFSNSKLVAR